MEKDGPEREITERLKAMEKTLTQMHEERDAAGTSISDAQQLVSEHREKLDPPAGTESAQRARTAGTGDDPSDAGPRRERSGPGE